MQRKAEHKAGDKTTPKQVASTKTSGVSRDDPFALQILSLHQTVGNRAVQRLFDSGGVQAKLSIGRSDDIFEKEADRAADEVMRMSGPQVQRKGADTIRSETVGGITPRVQRQSAPSKQAKPSATGNAAITTKAAERTIGDIGDAYDWEKGWWYSRNTQLSGWRSKPKDWEKNQGANPPSGEGVVNWGSGQYTCNLFVYDVLYDAGYTPPMHSNGHYYDAVETYKLKGGLEDYFQIILEPDEVLPGDVMATGGHVEIVTSNIKADGSFRAIGAHEDGAYETEKTYHKGLRFFRVKAAANAEESEAKAVPVQPKAEGAAPQAAPGFEPAVNALRGGGAPLSQDVRTFFETRFGRDFAGVRIHTDARANQLARSINARAFTRGEDIVFGSGEYTPASPGGKRLLGHELAHVLQQSPGIRRTPNNTVTAPSLTNRRFIGDRILNKILLGRIARLSTRHNGRRGAVAKVQHALVDLGIELPMHQADGRYGDETEDAISQFRTRYGPSAGKYLDGSTLAVLDKTAPKPGGQQRHTVDYDRLLADGRLDVTVGIGATDEVVYRQLPGRRKKYKKTKQAAEVLMAKRFRAWMRKQGFSLELLGLAGNQYWKTTRTLAWTSADGSRKSRKVDIWINLIVPHRGAAAAFKEGLSQGEITLYSGHARYGSGPDFDAKKSPLENFRIGIDTALKAAGRRTNVAKARRHGVAIDQEHDLLDMVRDKRFDPKRYRVLFFNACTSLAYLDEIRQHIGGTGTTDVIATRRPSMFTILESKVGLEEVQRFLEGILAIESVESIVKGLNDIQRGRHKGSNRFPRGGIFSSSGMVDNPKAP